MISIERKKQNKKDNPADNSDFIEEDELDDTAQQVYSLKKRLVKKPDKKSPLMTVSNSFINLDDKNRV